MDGTDAERCGRCAMSTVVDATAAEDEGRASRDPYGGERIEVDEEELRVVSPAAWIEGVVRRLDDLAARVVYGK